MSIHQRPTSPILSTGLKFGLLAAGIVLMAGCAQQQSQGYYDQPRGNSISDSQYTGEGGQYRNVVRAPSQLQISIDRDGRQQAQARAADPVAPPQGADAAGTTQAVPLGEQRTAATSSDVNPAAAGFAPQAQTYAGTLPCLAAGMNCTGQKMVLTLAPNGRWRARLAFLDATGTAGKASVEQGCWDASTARPIRVLLTDTQGNARADFVSIDNALRVRSMDGQTPNLAYNLTRQPDIDPIDELSGKPVPSCS